LRLLDHIGQAMRWYLPTSADTGDPLVMSFHRIGLSVAHGFDYGSLHEDTTRGLERAAVTAERIIDARLETLERPPTVGATTLQAGVPGMTLRSARR
jgi:hypothetical protein